MSNLLPSQELKRTRGYFRDRFIAAGSLVAIICGIGALLALLPVYTMVRGAQEEEGTTIAQSGISEDADREDIARARLLLHGLETASATSTSVLDILSEVFEARPAGLSITNVYFERGEAGAILLSGASASRDDAALYRDMLLKKARFTSVVVPIGVLTGASGKTYTMTIKGKF